MENKSKEKSRVFQIAVFTEIEEEKKMENKKKKKDMVTERNFLSFTWMGD